MKLIIIYIIWGILFFVSLILKDSKNERKSGIGYALITLLLFIHLAILIILPILI